MRLLGRTPPIDRRAHPNALAVLEQVPVNETRALRAPVTVMEAPC